MKLNEVATPLPSEEDKILQEQANVDPMHSMLYGIDPDNPSYDSTMAELARVRKYNRKLYDKIINLG